MGRLAQRLTYKMSDQLKERKPKRATTERSNTKRANDKKSDYRKGE